MSCNPRRDHTADQQRPECGSAPRGMAFGIFIAGSVALSGEGMKQRHRGVVHLFVATRENLDRKELRITEDLGEG